ncbi:MAG: ferritin family protein [Deltaproteobacteria bacterium]|nr:ferritin family protein [Deltaproteobacteria bacterium]
MDADLTPVEVVGLGIRSEEDAAEFYGTIAKMIKNDLVKAKFESLAREEVGHKQVLSALYKRMTGESAPPKIPGSPNTAEGGGIPVGVDNIEGLLELAISREHSANMFYRDAAKKAKDNNGKRTLEYLAGIEHGHEVMLKEELKAYLNDKDWYSNNPDIQLVGP